MQQDAASPLVIMHSALERHLVRAPRFKAQLTHLVSLLHALCVMHLRTDWDLTNIQPHSTARGPPVQVGPAFAERSQPARGVQLASPFGGGLHAVAGHELSAQRVSEAGGRGWWVMQRLACRTRRA